MVVRKETVKPKPLPVPRAPYTSKIIKATALLGDTKTLLAHWDLSATAADNFQRLQRENVFGKASRSRVEDILNIFRQRFMAEESVTKALVLLVNERFPTTSLDRILYFHAARADRLLFDVVTELFFEKQAQGLVDLHVADVQRSIQRLVTEGKTTSAWSEITTLRVTQSLLAALRDFGVLQGADNKKIAPAYLPVEAFAYIAFYLKQHQPSGAKLVELPDWRLFFLPLEGVERFLFDAHQHGLLEYHAAGTVTRLTFPTESLEEYANVLAHRVR
jgi:hypothetical protein